MSDNQEGEKLKEMLAAVGSKPGGSLKASKAALTQEQEQQLNEMLAAVGIKKDSAQQ
ncbi:hypothetical protein [Paenibacillus sp. JMULE4]|uniref:hypothetical protein n=1 Tax=Paenibacillus TaxID=44249 RepID=UPI00157533B9|nr:hypothetical protein [Paenibacillus sp. JMULE4]